MLLKSLQHQMAVSTTIIQISLERLLSTRKVAYFYQMFMALYLCCDAARIREILENVGLAHEGLASNVVGFLVAMGDISLRKTSMEEKRTKVQKESKVLLDYTRKALARLMYLKRILAQLEDDVAPCEVQMENWKTNLATMAAKEIQYLQHGANYKAMLNHVGYTPEISHGVLVEMAEHKKELEKKTNPINNTLYNYLNLHADKALDALTIECKKREYVD
ncbi:hypothetical protein UlMin_008880 [Ulmus minor]